MRGVLLIQVLHRCVRSSLGGLEMAPRFRILTVEVSNKAVICTICLRRDEKASHLKVRVKYENLTSVAFFQFFYLEIDRC